MKGTGAKQNHPSQSSQVFGSAHWDRLVFSGKNVINTKPECVFFVLFFNQEAANTGLNVLLPGDLVKRFC